MKLEEMKSLWAEMSIKLENQKCLTDKLILDMTQERYVNKFTKIQMYESVGAIICFAAALIIIINLGKLDTWYLLTFGIITIAFLILMPILVLRSIKSIKHLNLTSNNYKETIISFAKAKKNLLTFQKAGIYLSFLLALVIMPVASKIFNNKDFFNTEHSTKFWIVLPLFFVGLFFFAKWGYRSYQNITNSAENILKELEN